MGSNGDISEMADPVIENALQELSNLEKDFAAVEIDSSQSPDPVVLPKPQFSC